MRTLRPCDCVGRGVAPWNLRAASRASPSLTVIDALPRGLRGMTSGCRGSDPDRRGGTRGTRHRSPMSPTASPEIGLHPYDTDVLVTPPGHGPCMSNERALVGGRAAVQVVAAKPRSSAVLPQLRDKVVLDLVEGDRAPATDALAAAGRAVRGTSWAGYRSGRCRLATMAASYLRWLAPPATWSFVGAPSVSGRRAVAWLSPAGELQLPRSQTACPPSWHRTHSARRGPGRTIGAGPPQFLDARWDDMWSPPRPNHS